MVAFYSSPDINSHVFPFLYFIHAQRNGWFSKLLDGGVYSMLVYFEIGAVNRC